MSFLSFLIKQEPNTGDWYLFDYCIFTLVISYPLPQAKPFRQLFIVRIIKTEKTPCPIKLYPKLKPWEKKKKRVSFTTGVEEILHTRADRGQNKTRFWKRKAISGVS